MKNDRPYLEDIAAAIARIDRYTAAGRDAFFADEMAQDAVVRNFEIIGEATKRLAPETRGRHPQVRWSDVAGLGDVLIHPYISVDLGRVWQIVEHELPTMRRAVDELLGR